MEPKNKEKKIRMAIAGIGNCCSSLVQGLYYYKNVKNDDELVPGLMHNVVGDYKISDIEPWPLSISTNAKLAKTMTEAIFAGSQLYQSICPRSAQNRRQSANGSDSWTAWPTT